MLLLVTGKDTTNPGRYERKGKTSSEVIGDIANVVFSKETLKGLAQSLSPFNTKLRILGVEVDRLQQAYSGLDTSLLVNPACDVALKKINVIDRKTIKESSIQYDSTIFSGMFSSSKQYEIALKALPSNDSDILIAGPRSAKEIFQKDLTSGIYILHNNQPFSASDFSTSVFEQLRVSIIDVFSSLGAREIKVIDKTDHRLSSTLQVDKEIISLAPKLNLNLKRSSKFNIEASLEGIRSIPDQSQQEIRTKLRDAPELLKIAEYSLKNPGSVKTVKKEISLNISFGLNASLVTVFQGAFEGGYERQFSVEITF